VSVQQNNLAVLYSFCNSFFSYIMLINVHLFDILPAISSGKVGDFFCLEHGVPNIASLCRKLR